MERLLAETPHLLYIIEHLVKFSDHLKNNMPKRKKPDDDEVVVLFASHFGGEVTPHPVSDDDTTVQVRGRPKAEEN